MREQSIRCALWLRKNDIGPGDIVAICAGVRLDNYIPFFAAYYEGAIYNAWYHDINYRT